MTWTPDAIAAFEDGIHPPASCPLGGCAQCNPPAAPTPSRHPNDRTAHRAMCVDEEGSLVCVCGIGNPFDGFAR